MPKHDNHLFHDDEIQRFDANTIQSRYGNNWKNFASNVREVTQPDGSIVKEYIIEDPSLLEEIKTSSQPVNSMSSSIILDDEQQPKETTRNKFAQIKAKFEQKNTSNVMASPAHNGYSSRESSRKEIDNLYARHRRSSNESIPVDRINHDYGSNASSSFNQFAKVQNNYQRSQSIGSERSRISSLRRFDSADEDDEEVRRIHRQGEDFRRRNQEISSLSSDSTINPQQHRVQYEIVDEEGNPMAINDVQDLIKMSGVRAREVPQPDGTVIKEYVIDDPQVLSQFRSQQQTQGQSPMTTSYIQQPTIDQDAPPPPPRIPLRSSMLFRQGGSSMNDDLLHNIQQIHVLEPQRRYEYLTTNGRRIQFLITNSDSFNAQSITDSDIRELTNAIHSRLAPSSTPTIQQQQQQQQQQQPQQSSTQPAFNLPKQWYPSVDLTHRQRLASDNQLNSNNANTNFQQMPADLTRSGSYGTLHQRSYHPQNRQEMSHEPNKSWDTSRYHQDLNNPRRHQHDAIQTSAQFLPQQQQQQQSKSTHSPPIDHNPPPVYYQQSMAYPYRGQQQHGVQIINDFNQQRTAMTADGHTRI